MKVCGNPVSNKSIGAIFPTAFAYFVSVSHFSNSRSSSDFFIIVIICYGDLWSVIFDVTIAKNYDLLKAYMMVSIFWQ